ncbi:MAG: ATPase [Treponema sp.]|jgi:hypothetical protein|nr:ATPase [Treponema sp.]
MEELQSTEGLDREILEDARKKAFKILKGADDSTAASKTAWERKLQDTLEKAREQYAQRAETSRREILARLPIDKRRIRSERIESLLNRAMTGFLASLDRPRLLRILERELARTGAGIERNSPDGGPPASAAGKAGGEIRYRDLSAAELAALMEKNLPGLPLPRREDPLSMVDGAFPALVIDLPQLRITASVDRAAEALLLDKRAELVEALLGKAALLDTVEDGGGHD